MTADSAALCLKSGNACVLRGGSEAIHSNTAIAAVLGEAAEKAGIPPGAISFVDRPDRELVPVLLKQDRYIDLIIPRGGPSLMKTIAEHATIPVLKHDAGICHMYVDADVDQAAFACFFEDAGIEISGENFGENGENIKLHGLILSSLSMGWNAKPPLDRLKIFMVI